MSDDPTRFVERGFTWVENKEHSVRLIDRNNSKQAISIAWADLPSLRELIVLALGDGKLKGTTTPPDFTEQAQRLVGDIKREAVGIFPLYSPGEELREIMVRGIVSLAVKADARGQVTGRQAFASELLGHLDRITSTTAAYHLVRNLCLIELGREPDSTGAAI